MKYKRITSVLLVCLSWVAAGQGQTQGSNDRRAGRSNKVNILALPTLFPGQQQGSRQASGLRGDAVALGLAKAKVYKFITVDYPGAAFSSMIDTNGITSVGNYVFDPSGAVLTSIPFTFSGGVYKTLIVPGATTSAVTGINTEGQTVGYYVDVAGLIHGFLDDKGSFSTIDCPGAATTIVFDVNDSGQLAGTFSDANNDQHGFVDNAGVCTSLDFPGAVNTNATGLNGAGDVVGLWQDTSSNVRSFVYKASTGSFTEVSFPLAGTTQAVGINDAGEISGSYFDGASAIHGFIYSDGNFAQVDVAGTSGTVLGRITNSGIVSGNFIDALGETHGLKGH